MNAGPQPWKGAFDQMMGHSLASLSRTPKPRAIVECGSFSKPNNGCTDERQDALGISVFLEDRASYDKAVTEFRGRVPAFIYIASDGTLPEAPPGSGIDTRAEIIKYWQGQSTFMDGLTQETCRDFTHTGYGLSAISHFAETTRIQGQDLYPKISERLRHALGMHAKYQLGAAVPSSLCGGTPHLGLGPITEVGFNALNNRMGIAMTNTQRLTEQQRPAGTNVLFVAWETLTHAANSN
ncbi:hypothetical protein [Streptosporangium sp. NPDC049304]|uniref:hypothetical protein n=1 Tax=Streptosporangium sp. NPDC049304 TaxID=3154830 RepID=UPI003416131F